MKIIVHTKNGLFEYEADYVSQNCDSFLHVVRKENPQEKSYTEGSLWWKRIKTYTEYDHNDIAMHQTKLVVRVEL